MSTFTEIKANIRVNLDDAGAVNYSTEDLNQSVQDAYDDIALLTKCIVKKQTSIPWKANLSYYDFHNSINDFIGVLAIYNNGTHLWLEDNVSLRQLNNINPKWELINGATRFWIPISLKYIAVYPKYSDETQTFDLVYGAAAPVVTDSDTPLIVSDMQDLIEIYVTGDLLEQFEEFTKAQEWWNLYYPRIEEYSTRVKLLAQNDLIITQ